MVRGHAPRHALKGEPCHLGLPGQRSAGRTAPFCGELALVWLLSALAACLMTWPLVLELGRVGRVDSNDGAFSIWNVAWVAHALVSDPRRLFDANIFYPSHGTLTYSEPNLAAGVLAAPVYWATENPYLAHNFVVLFAFTLSGVAAYSLVRHLTGHPGAAAASAVAFAYCPYVMSHTAHIQLLLTAGLPFGLLALHRLVEQPTLGRGAVLGLAVAGQTLACGYYGVFLTLAIGVAVCALALFDPRGRRVRFWAAVGAGAVVALVLLLPLILRFDHLQRGLGFVRPLDEARRFAADWRSYAASPARAHQGLLALLPHWNEVLFPGVIVTLFAVEELWRIVRRRAFDVAVLYGVGALLAAWASFGPAAGLYTVLYRLVPWFTLMHAPARFGLLVTLAGGVLAGFAIARGLRSSRHPRLAAAVLTLFVAAELTVVPLRFPAAPEAADAYRLLKSLPRGPVVELPFFSQRSFLHGHARYMLNSTAHWQPLVNGYSDFIPQGFRELAPALAAFPTIESLESLHTLGVRYVVFTLSAYPPSLRSGVDARIAEFPAYLRPLDVDNDVRLYELVGRRSQRSHATSRRSSEGSDDRRTPPASPMNPMPKRADPKGNASEADATASASEPNKPGNR